MREALVIALLALGGVTCASREVQPPAAGTRHEVQMRAVAFAPRELTVHLGDTISWKNVDIVRHNALRPNTFDTGELKPGESHNWTPADTGTYAYRCTIHQRMRGRITVVSKVESRK